MVEFIDKTTEQAGTPINRKNLMAIQGFVAETTVFNDDGTITKTNGNGETLTITFNIDGEWFKSTAYRNGSVTENKTDNVFCVYIE